MDTTAGLARDLAFIRDGVERARQPVNCAPIYFLWAGIITVGFALIDFAEPWTGPYWAVAGPGGGIVSAVLGFRAARTAGQKDKSDGLLQAAHWGGMMVCIFLSQVMVSLGGMQHAHGTALTILIVGMGYFYAGLYVQRALLWIAGLQLVGVFVVLFTPNPPWTLIGLSTAAGLVALGVHDRRERITHRGPVLVT